MTKPTEAEIAAFAITAQCAFMHMLGRAKRMRPDGFTADELNAATQEAWRAAVRAVLGQPQ